VSEIDLLESVPAKSGSLIAVVGADQWGRPTPCPDYDVRGLVDHMVGTATAQAVPYSDAEATETPGRAESTLPPEYRGDGQPFGPVAAVAADAGPVDRAVAFLGRNPAAG
jgi:hypothetical protein